MVNVCAQNSHVSIVLRDPKHKKAPVPSAVMPEGGNRNAGNRLYIKSVPCVFGGFNHRIQQIHFFFIRIQAIRFLDIHSIGDSLRHITKKSISCVFAQSVFLCFILFFRAISIGAEGQPEAIFCEKVIIK